MRQTTARWLWVVADGPVPHELETHANRHGESPATWRGPFYPAGTRFGPYAEKDRDHAERGAAFLASRYGVSARVTE